jgi:hypothetical protein
MMFSSEYGSLAQGRLQLNNQVLEYINHIIFATEALSMPFPAVYGIAIPVQADWFNTSQSL